MQLIWPEVYYDKIRDNITQVSTNTTLTCATNRTETGEIDNRNNNVDKTRFSNRQVQTLTKRTFTTCFQID